LAGSSDVFLGGVVSYADGSKVRDLDVPAGLIEEHGAVSEEVARAMVEGVVRRFGSDAGISITGIAGPGGGTEKKPVGTVWYAASVRGEVAARRSVFPGSRADVRERSAQAALHLLLRSVERSAPEP
ncbi:MAG TPA: nicotinamide-nucleotide amidohydrolase family protein, partial [Longimicrobiales bacterium]|nr:nicotinamide-nucleotide amidohydrolase family protein [Longimicrobiales bacterium]